MVGAAILGWAEAQPAVGPALAAEILVETLGRMQASTAEPPTATPDAKRTKNVNPA